MVLGEGGLCGCGGQWGGGREEGVVLDEHRRAGRDLEEAGAGERPEVVVADDDAGAVDEEAVGAHVEPFEDVALEDEAGERDALRDAGDVVPPHFGEDRVPDRAGRGRDGRWCG